MANLIDFDYSHLQTAMMQALQKESYYSTDDTNILTIRLRILKNIADIIPIHWEDGVMNIMKGKIYVDPVWSRELYARCEWTTDTSTLDTNHYNAESNDKKLILRFVSQDYHTLADLKRIVSVIEKRVPLNDVIRIFAIDGTKGYQPIDYIERLSHSPQNIARNNLPALHSGAVRYMYSHCVGNGMIPFIQKLLDGQETTTGDGEEEKDTYMETYKSFMGDENTFHNVLTWLRKKRHPKEENNKSQQNKKRKNDKKGEGREIVETKRVCLSPTESLSQEK